ncbi:TVP38/TMEM64 family protein [Cytobacillus purgationiresistens]|uniref:Membrane protein YdjX (TVP38/TMEM64 family) n=1 Tax=Cytobacillus purgationiresistens TaxID=863449 RepID=A0ABU0AJ15_9BACI|nr:VTT domain-containing protein [Cytobacillus purgationiresistens]MDQ0270065.1 putative membrane protein YdjX (TVP38/TMEM64 family) [Cytobacillus purgationiresistens]
MNEQLAIAYGIVETAGILAPIAFILFHILRQFLFIPVPLVCIAGGVLFGSVFGSIFSLIGLMFSCLMFYGLINQMPKTHSKLSELKKRWFGEYRNLSIGQISVLRLVPFVHYHLLNFCLLERNKGFSDFMKGAWLTNLPLAVFYTVFGQFISRFTPTMILLILFSIASLAFVLREKVTVIKWHEFFKSAA